MKFFIKKIFLFFALIALYFTVNATINYFIYSNVEISLPQTTVLITGDSFVRNSLNPHYYPNSQNIAHAGEVYPFSYWKLRRVLESNDPDTIILGFAPHNIAKYVDSKFFNEEYARAMFGQYYPIEHLEELDSRIDVNYSAFYKTVWKQTAFYPKLTHNQFMDEYKNSPPATSLDPNRVVEKMFLSNTEAVDISATSIDYLDSIVKLCQAKKITLVLATSPVHKGFFKKIPLPLLKKHIALKEKYQNQVLFFDRLSKQYPDSCFTDANHLSRHGAKLFTQELAQYLKENRRKE
jgi:hypothetical protein